MEKTIYFKVGELAEYLPERPSIHTIKKWVQLDKIPYEKAGSARNAKLIFNKEKIDHWMEKGRPENKTEVKPEK